MESTIENEEILMTVTLEARMVTMVTLEAREMKKMVDASMTGVESLERDQVCYKYLYMFVGSTCGFMHRPIFMQKLIELSRSF